MMRRMSPANGGGLVASSPSHAVVAPGSSADSTNTQRRSTVYFTHNFQETHQPGWLRHKEAPMMQYEKYNWRDNQLRQQTMHGWDKQRAECGHNNPLKHMNLWGDTDMSRNNNLAHFWETYQTYNNLIGRPTDVSGWGKYYRTGWTDYEMKTDQRYQGMDANSAINYTRSFGNDSHKLLPMYHPERHQPHGELEVIPGVVGTTAKVGAGAQALGPFGPGHIHDPQVKATAEKQYPHLKAMYNKGIAPLGSGRLRDFNTEETALYWKQLHALINIHGDAVGEIVPGENRDITKVHKYFVDFQQAFSSFEMQDGHLLSALNETRPAELDDLYGIFLGMEINYLNQDYCPRCSLPYATTESCGEGAGHLHARFKKYRGRYKPHKPWGKEWFDVVANRSEQLWYRATEDPHFGQAQHTQLQAERLLDIYCRTQQRGRANTFVNRLYASEEYLSGKIQWTPTMARNYDRLLELTPHPHLLTGAYKQDGQLAGQLLGSSTAVPNSPQQVRIDLELAKVRREQKEEGVVKLPPKDYSLDMKSVVGYQMQQGRVRNWKEVKQGLEKSFLSSGLPESAFAAADTRELMYLEDAIQQADATVARYKKEFETDRKALMSSGAGKKGFVFPDRHYYQCFDISPKAFEAFENKGFGSGRMSCGMQIRAQCRSFKDPANIDFNDTTQGTRYPVDIRDSTCEQYGFLAGTQLNIQGASDGKPRAVIVFGVGKQGSNRDHALLAFDAATEEIVNLGRDLKEVRNRWRKKLEVTHQQQPLRVLAASRDFTDVQKGRVVGVRHGALWVQWNQDIATCLGQPSDVATLFNIKKTTAALQDPTEPLSWNVPFRNKNLEERLTKVKEAPWRQGNQSSSGAHGEYGSESGADSNSGGVGSNSPHYVSIIPNKFTPKAKKFGYSQNDERGDFHTAEYKDRLKSRQFYTNSQKFQVLPDRRDKSVNFTSSKPQGSANGGGNAMENDGGGNSYNRLAGLPSVDRNELDQGYLENVSAETMATGGVSKTEVAEVEQALRDISGRRPGNFVKGPDEKNNLQLNEGWFRTFHSGWKHHNEKQKLIPETERRLIDHLRLPFSGEVPPAGITMGIGERYKGVMDDWSKGFDIGPDGHGAGSDKSRFDQFKVSTDRAEALGKSNVLLRMFNEKLADLHLSIQQFVSSDERATGCLGTNPKKMMLGINEWRNSGKAPSLLVLRMLSVFLKPEIEAYNEFIPAVAANHSNSGVGSTPEDVERHKVHRIRIDQHLGLITQSAVSAQGSFVDVDPFSFKMEAYAKDAGATSISSIGANLGAESIGGGGGFGGKGGMRGPQLNATASVGDGFLQQAYVALAVKRKMNPNAKAPLLEGYLTDEALRRFNAIFTDAIGKDIPQDQQALRQSGGSDEKRSGGNKGFAMQLVTVEHIEACLEKLGFDTDLRMRIATGLDRDFVDNTSRYTVGGANGRDNTVAIPYSLLLNWKGPFTTKAAGRNLGLGNTDKDTEKHPAEQPEGQGMKDLMERLSATHEGLVMDMQYKIRMNKQCPKQFAEFCRLAQFGTLAATQGGDVEATLKGLFEKYVAGTWVPDVEEGSKMLQAFLKNLLVKDSAALVTAKAEGYFDAVPGSNGKVLLEVNPLSLEAMPFMFESGKSEYKNMVAEMRQMGISGSAGPELEATRNFKLVSKGSVAYQYSTAGRYGGDRGAGFGSGGRSGPKNAEEVPTFDLMKLLKNDNAICAGSDLRFVLDLSEVDFYKYCTKIMLRAFPLLPEWHAFVARAANEYDLDAKKVNQSRAGLRSLLDEMQRDMEAEFKQNSEKYWTKIIDNAGRDDGGGRGGGGGGRFGGGGGGGGHFSGGGQHRGDGGQRRPRTEGAKMDNRPQQQGGGGASDGSGSDVLSSIGVGSSGSTAGANLGPRQQKPKMMSPKTGGARSSPMRGGSGGARGGSGMQHSAGRGSGRGKGALEFMESIGAGRGSGRGSRK